MAHINAILIIIFLLIVIYTDEYLNNTLYTQKFEKTPFQNYLRFKIQMQKRKKIINLNEVCFLSQNIFPSEISNLNLV